MKKSNVENKTYICEAVNNSCPGHCTHAKPHAWEEIYPLKGDGCDTPGQCLSADLDNIKCVEVK